MKRRRRYFGDFNSNLADLINRANQVTVSNLNQPAMPPTTPWDSCTRQGGQWVGLSPTDPNGICSAPTDQRQMLVPTRMPTGIVGPQYDLQPLAQATASPLPVNGVCPPGWSYTITNPGASEPNGVCVQMPPNSVASNYPSVVATAAPPPMPMADWAPQIPNTPAMAVQASTTTTPVPSGLAPAAPVSAPAKPGWLLPAAALIGFALLKSKAE